MCVDTVTITKAKIDCFIFYIQKINTILANLREREKKKNTFIFIYKHKTYTYAIPSIYAILSVGFLLIE